MSGAFHRGVTQELRRKLQTAGIRLEEQDAQKVMAGADVVKVTSPAKETIANISHEVWRDRFGLMSRWENDHPGESPFPPIFAEVVLAKLREAALDPDTLPDAVREVIMLAEGELEL